MIAVDFIEYEEVAEDAHIIHGDASLDEYDGSGLVWEVVTEEVQYMQKDLKSSSISSYMLKPSKLLTQGFYNNRTSQGKLFKHMCNFWSRAEWRKGVRVFSSYLDADITKYQCRILNHSYSTDRKSVE